MKRNIQLFKTILLICTLIISFHYEIFFAQITDSYDISSIIATMNINSNGQMNVIYRSVCNATTTNKMEITTYVEKKILGLYWERVNINTINNEWIDTIYDFHYNDCRSVQLSSRGIFRCTVVFHIYDINGICTQFSFQTTDFY